MPGGVADSTFLFYYPYSWSNFLGGKRTVSIFAKRVALSKLAICRKNEIHREIQEHPPSDPSYLFQLLPFCVPASGTQSYHLFLEGDTLLCAPMPLYILIPPPGMPFPAFLRRCLQDSSSFKESPPLQPPQVPWAERTPPKSSQQPVPSGCSKEVP